MHDRHTGNLTVDLGIHGVIDGTMDGKGNITFQFAPFYSLLLAAQKIVHERELKSLPLGTAAKLNDAIKQIEIVLSSIGHARQETKPQAMIKRMRPRNIKFIDATQEDWTTLESDDGSDCESSYNGKACDHVNGKPCGVCPDCDES